MLGRQQQSGRTIGRATRLCSTFNFGRAAVVIPLQKPIFPILAFPALPWLCYWAIMGCYCSAKSSAVQEIKGKFQKRGKQVKRHEMHKPLIDTAVRQLGNWLGQGGRCEVHQADEQSGLDPYTFGVFFHVFFFTYAIKPFCIVVSTIHVLCCIFPYKYFNAINFIYKAAVFVPTPDLSRSINTSYIHLAPEHCIYPHGTILGLAATPIPLPI